MNRTEEILNLLKDHKRRINHLERLEPAVAAVFDRAIVINESGNDADFRVEAIGQPNALFVQGSDGRVGLKTNTPDADLHVLSNTGVTIHAEGTGAGNFSQFQVESDSAQGFLRAYGTTEGGTSAGITRSDWVEIVTSGASGILINAVQNVPIVFAQNDTERARITSVGLGVGLTPTANMPGLSIEAGLLTLKERATPTAEAGYGKIYPKASHYLYYQTSTGVEYQIMMSPPE